MVEWLSNKQAQFILFQNLFYKSLKSENNYETWNIFFIKSNVVFQLFSPIAGLYWASKERAIFHKSDHA